MDEITANTDIDLSYKSIKRGRSVVGFSFTVREKHRSETIALEQDESELSMLCNLSDKQVNYYATVMSKLHSIIDLAGSKDYQTFAIWIGNILRDPTNVSEDIARRIFKALRTETDFKG